MCARTAVIELKYKLYDLQVDIKKFNNNLTDKSVTVKTLKTLLTYHIIQFWVIPTISPQWRK